MSYQVLLEDAIKAKDWTVGQWNEPVAEYNLAHSGILSAVERFHKWMSDIESGAVSVSDDVVWKTPSEERVLEDEDEMFYSHDLWDTLEPDDTASCHGKSSHYSKTPQDRLEFWNDCVLMGSYQEERVGPSVPWGIPLPPSHTD